MNWRSLRAKLTISLSIVAIALIGLAGLAVFELQALEKRIAIEHTTTTLFDLVREVRNRENRLFLFRKSVEFNELLQAVDASSDYLNQNIPWPSEPQAKDVLTQLRTALGAYRDELLTYWRQGRHHRETAEQAEDRIRLKRRDLIDLSEWLSKTSQEAVQRGLGRHRLSLAVGIALLVAVMAVVANFLTRRIVRPLKSIERQMELVGDGRIDRVEFSWQDRELVSLATAFNHVMSELESRQSGMVQAEKLAALGTMLSGVAHELNNPLSNISTTVQIVSEEIEHLAADEVRSLLDRVDQQTERARKIVRSLLEFARDDREQLRIVDARAIVDGAIDAVNQGQANPRAILVDCPPGLMLAANAERLLRALINLVDNAIAATDAADPIVVFVRRVGLADGSAAVELSVQDCGSGLAAEQRARMFDPFYTTKPAGQGTGLGLFITHEIVKQHGGTIDVSSIPGAGTSVSIRIPVRQRNGTP